MDENLLQVFLVENKLAVSLPYSIFARNPGVKAVHLCDTANMRNFEICRCVVMRHGHCASTPNLFGRSREPA